MIVDMRLLLSLKKMVIEPIILDTRREPKFRNNRMKQKNLGIQIKFSYVVVAAKGL